MNPTSPPKTETKTPGLPQEQLVAEVEAGIRDTVRARDLPRDLADAVLYAALGPGKRVRPTLVVRSYEAVAGPSGHKPLSALSDAEGLLPAAAAIEMVHAFSLVHDDLPAMDDDDLRRGRPTLHKHTNEAMAILAGDTLLALSVEVIATGVADAALSGRLIRALTVGTNDMIAGQVYDTFPDRDDHLPTIDRLSRVHRHKTGALLRAAARMGGHVAGANAEQLQALTDYADAIGLMFQVVDDVLDVTSDAAAMGKATQKDAAAGKLTYPGLMGLDGARAEVQRLREAAHAALAPLGGDSGDSGPIATLKQFADDLAVRRK
ncbi:MAG: polyprenyl synthetase family protein [Planctomycetota bacterium]